MSGRVNIDDGVYMYNSKQMPIGQGTNRESGKGGQVVLQ